MAKLKMQDLQGKTPKELVKMRNQYKGELFSLRMRNFMRGLKQTHLIKEKRRDIARINTALNHKVKS